MTIKAEQNISVIFEENIENFKKIYSNKKSTIVSLTTEFCHYINKLDHIPLSNNSMELEQLLINWKNHYLSSKIELKDTTVRGYIRLIYGCFRILISNKKIPIIEIPKVLDNNKKSKNTDHKKKDVKNVPFKNTTYIFICVTNKPNEFGAKVDVTFLSKFENGKKIAIEFKHYLEGYAYHTQLSKKSNLTSFFNHLNQLENISDEKLLSSSFMQPVVNDYIDGLINNREFTLITVNKKILTTRKIYNHLARKNLIARIDFPKHIAGVDKLTSKLKTQTRLLAMSVRNIKRYDESGELIKSAFELSNEIDDIFLSALERDEKFAFNSIRQAAINDVKKYVSIFEKGQKLISSVDIDYIQSIYKRDNELQDPRYKGTNNSQSVSFFSNSHPNGFANLLSYYWHEYHGLAMADFKGSHWLSEHGSLKIRDHLGLHSANALPFFIVILGETGLNVSSLEKAKITDENGKTLILIPTDNGNVVRFNVNKPRARKTLSKLITKNSSELLSSNEDEVNAYYCLKAVIKMTAQYRKAKKSRDLWIGPFSKKLPTQPSRISESAFKSQLNNFIKKNSSLSEFDLSYISRANIRVSGSIIRWFETGGDVREVAKYLGNSPATALKNYITPELTELLNRREIRRFQRLLIIAATKHDSNLLQISLPEISEHEIVKIIHGEETSLTSSGKQLLDYLSRNGESKDNQKSSDKLTIVLSPLNVAIIKLTADSIKEINLADPLGENTRNPPNK